MATSIDKRTAELMVKRLQRKLDNLFAEQQSLNGNKGQGVMRKGGLVKAEGGYEEAPVNQNLNFGNEYKDYLTGKANYYDYRAPIKSIGQGNNLIPFGNTAKTIPNNNNVGLGQAASIGSQFLPGMYNFIKGLQKPDRVSPNYNPYNNEIRSTMRNRRFDINPLLNANLTAQAVTNRNIRNTAGSRGELMGNLTASQNARMAGDASAWSQKNNVDNQYLAEQAQMDYGLGSNISQMNWATQEANARNKAATNQFMGQSMIDFSNAGQMQQLMNNQQRTDIQRAGLIKDMYGVYRFMPGMQDIVKYMESLNKK